jgi:cytochrome P450
MLILIGIVILALLIGFVIITPHIFPGVPAGLEKDVYIPPRDPGFFGWTGNALKYYNQSTEFWRVTTDWYNEAKKQGKKGYMWKVFVFRNALHVIEAKDAQHILVGNASNYVKPPVVYKSLECFLGKRSILNMTDENEHKKLKLVVAPALNAKMAREVYGATVMPSHITQFCNHLEEECKKTADGSTTAHFTLSEELAGGVMLDAAYRADRVDTKDPNGLVGQFRRIQARLSTDYALILGIPVGVRSILRRIWGKAETVFSDIEQTVANIDKLTIKSIEDAKKIDDADKDHDRSLIDVMVRSQKGDPENPNAYKATNEDVVSNCSLLSFAGTETTSRTIYWCLTFLAHNPAVQETLFEELEDVVNPNAAPAFEEVANLQFLDATVRETLRVVPRLCVKDDVLPSGLKVPAGMEVGIAFVNFHHNQEVWGADATEWKPSRWFDEETMAKVAKSPCNWFPFALGPRICLGRDVALVESIIAIAAVARRFKIELANPKQKFPMPFVALAVRPDEPSPLKFVRRE